MTWESTERKLARVYRIGARPECSASLEAALTSKINIQTEKRTPRIHFWENDLEFLSPLAASMKVITLVICGIVNARNG